MREYDEDHCWQYDIRLKNKNSDINQLRFAGYTADDVPDLRINDFTFQYEDKANVFQEAKHFIERHEWLGKMGLYPTHIFTARLNGILAGVVVMDMPVAFSKMVGSHTRKIERLISRGACISWSPKNLASALIMFSIRWMVDNTRFRLFSAYSDPEAKELGTIYQACNFFYVGQKSGTKYQYKNNNGKWVSDRYFRSRSIYKKTAKELGITWDEGWQQRDRVIFKNMPTTIAENIKQAAKTYMDSCERRDVILKHKYVYILGTTKSETKRLKKAFHGRVKTFEYPKERGT